MVSVVDDAEEKKRVLARRNEPAIARAMAMADA